MSEFKLTWFYFINAVKQLLVLLGPNRLEVKGELGRSAGRPTRAVLVWVVRKTLSIVVGRCVGSGGRLVQDRYLPPENVLRTALPMFSLFFPNCSLGIRNNPSSEPEGTMRPNNIKTIKDLSMFVSAGFTEKVRSQQSDPKRPEPSGTEPVEVSQGHRREKVQVLINKRENVQIWRIPGVHGERADASCSAFRPVAKRVWQKYTRHTTSQECGNMQQGAEHNTHTHPHTPAQICVCRPRIKNIGN